jgi:hypothetical protein
MKTVLNMEERKEMYRCPSCKETKSASEFHKSSRIKRGLQYYCKPCINRMSETRRQQRIKNGPTVIRDSKVCAKCKTKKPISQFGIYRSAADGHVSYCKPCWVAITQKAQAKQRRI